MIDALEWTRPLAGWSLLFPFVVLALSFRRERTRPIALGTYALWQRLVVSGGDVRRRRVTPARWLWIGAICAACLALMGPRLKSAERLATLTVVVDRDVTMYLEHTAPDGSSTGRGTRFDGALSDLRALLNLPGFEGFDTEQIRWRTRFRDDSEHVGEFPESWRRACESDRGEPQPWSRFDNIGTLWLVDSLDVLPERAGWVRGGGGPVFGTAAQEGRRRYHWDGEQLAEESAPAVALTVWLDSGLPPAVRSLVAEWANVRGHEVLEYEDPPDVTGLSVHAVSFRVDADSPVLRAERDGWSIDGPVARTPALSVAGLPLRTWLEAVHEPMPVPVVGWRRGVIHVGLGDGVPRGDPAAFAVSWSRLLDGACRSAPGVRSVAQRKAVGGSDSRLPQLPAVGPAANAGDSIRRPLGAWLACAALALGGLALLLGGAGLR